MPHRLRELSLSCSLAESAQACTILWCVRHSQLVRTIKEDSESASASKAAQAVPPQLMQCVSPPDSWYDGTLRSMLNAAAGLCTGCVRCL